MDAYSSYIMRLSEARVDDLRREAADYALSQRARRSRGWRRRQLFARLARPPRTAVDPVTQAPFPIPVPE